MDGKGRQRMVSNGSQRYRTGVSFWDGTVARRKDDEMVTVTFQQKITLFYPRYFFYFPTENIEHMHIFTQAFHVA